MSDQRWLGQEAKDGARVGPLSLLEGNGNQLWCVILCDPYPHNSCTVVGWCPLSEVDARTREWLASLSALVPETRELLEAGERLRSALHRIQPHATQRDLRSYEEACDAYDAAKGKVQR